jgi:predicted acetyltransferase
VFWTRHGRLAEGPQVLVTDPFVFLDPGRLLDGDLELVLVARYPADASKGHAPMYRFEMRNTAAQQAMGAIDLRVGHTLHLERYAGHIGYRVEPEHRGHHYAARSCRLLFPLALQHGLDPLWITCDPGNLASRRTCELVGGTLVGIVSVPRNSELYLLGQYRKCRYRVNFDS